MQERDPKLVKGYVRIVQALTSELFWDAASPNHSCFELKFFRGASDTENLNSWIKQVKTAHSGGEPQQLSAFAAFQALEK